jgi:hypothetical protein
MAWWWPFGASAVSDADAATLRRRCGSRVSALAACRGANPANAGAACDAFAADVALCQATVLCAKAADAYIKCSTAERKRSAVSAELPDCDKQAAAMRKCLRGWAIPK